GFARDPLRGVCQLDPAAQCRDRGRLAAIPRGIRHCGAVPSAGAAPLPADRRREHRLMRGAALLCLALLTACGAPPRPVADVHVPPFARVPYQPFSRSAVVAIALREWRLFGSPVDDDPPGSYRPATPDDKPERQQGLWQRVGEYWWLAMNAGTLE